MITQKSVRGIALFARASSLENAQRVNTPRNKEKKRLADEFIAPMWCDPSTLSKKKATQH